MTDGPSRRNIMFSPLGDLSPPTPVPLSTGPPFLQSYAVDASLTSYTCRPWTNAGKALSACANVNSPGNCDLWAPDINYFDGQYVLYYSASTLSSQISVIGVATSPSMEPGTWTDHGEVISSTTGDVYNASLWSCSLFLERNSCSIQSTRTSSSPMVVCNFPSEVGNKVTGMVSGLRR